MPRKITTPFTFSDGTYVPPKNWVVVPQLVQMKDPANYANPETFDGNRFVKHTWEDAASESRLSHPSWRFPLWGSVKQAWSVPVSEALHLLSVKSASVRETNR